MRKSTNFQQLPTFIFSFDMPIRELGMVTKTHMTIALEKPVVRSAPGADFGCKPAPFKKIPENLRPTSQTRLRAMALVDQALQFPQVRQIKIDDIRRSLLRGSYRLDANATAEAMLNEGCDVGGRHVPLKARFASIRKRVSLSPQRYSYQRPVPSAKSDVLRKLVQDLNKKIGIIMVHTELMNLDPQLDSIHRMHLQVIRREAARLHNLVGRLDRGLTGKSGDEEK
jgi:signal transduction histidine kinase